MANHHFSSSTIYDKHSYMQEEEKSGERIINLTEKRGGVNPVFDSSYNNGAECIKSQSRVKPKLEPAVSDWYQDATTTDIVETLEKRALAVAIREIYEHSPWFEQDQKEEEYLIRMVFNNKNSTRPFREMFEYFNTRLSNSIHGYTIYDIVLGFGSFFDIEFERLCNEVLTIQERSALVTEIYQMGLRLEDEHDQEFSIYDVF